MNLTVLFTSRFPEIDSRAKFREESFRLKIRDRYTIFFVPVPENRNGKIMKLNVYYTLDYFKTKSTDVKNCLLMLMDEIIRD